MRQEININLPDSWKDITLRKYLELQRDLQNHEDDPMISYGAYLDITKYDTLGIDTNWAKIMSILYRPVIRKKKERYEISSYQGEIDDELFLDVGMDVHFGAWFFFINLQMDLLNYTLKFTNLTGLPPNIKLILEKSGKAIRQSLNSQMETYKKWMK